MIEQIGATTIVQIFNFLILLYLLKKLVFNDLMKALEERRRKIEHDLDEADRLNAEAQDLKQEYEDKLRQARQMAQEAVQKAAQEGERLKSSLVDEGRAEARRLVESGRQEVSSERERIFGELEAHVADRAVDVAGKALKDLLDGPTQARMVTLVAEKVGSGHVA